MQKIFSVTYSSDTRFILTGSDDTNIRIWKTNASKALGIPSGREERKLQYSETIKKRFSHMPEIQRINRDKKLPKPIKKAVALRHVQATSERAKQDNRKRHSREDDANIAPERKRAVVKEFT